jgi:hypothetical protein
VSSSVHERAIGSATLRAFAVTTRQAAGGIEASPWGWIAFGAAVVSAIGYALQTILDYVREPALVGEIEFYGLFAGFAIAALLAGTVALITGWRSGDHTRRLGLVAIAYVVLVQAIQSLWD